MSKHQKSAGLAFSDATPQQLAQAKQIIEDADRHRYYVTRIYGVYNAVSGKNDAPSTCASCLRTRVREIKKWYEEGQKYAAYITSKKQSPTPPVVEPVKDVKPPVVSGDLASGPDSTATVTIEGGVITDVNVVDKNSQVDQSDAKEGQDTVEVKKLLATTHGGVMVFTTNEGAEFENGVKGNVVWDDGKKVNAGTYKTTEGHDVKVQVGGKATYAENYDDLL